MEHHCHARNCPVEVEPKLFMCKRHWYMLPKPMRDAVWSAYEAGQEIRKDPTEHYLEVTDAAIKYVWEKEQSGLGTRKPTSYDTETHLIAPGNLTPRLVCASWKESGQKPEMAAREGALAKGRAILEDPDRVLVAANAAFDMGVLVAADPSLLPVVFQAYEEDRISDTHVRQALGDIHDGCLFRDRETNAPLGRYSMQYLARLYLGLNLEAVKNDPNSVRLRYCEMEGKPLAEYPKAFVDYSLNDAEEELEVWLKQAGLENLHNEGAQVRAAWCLHLMACWGIRTDPVAVAAFAERIEAAYQKGLKTFLKAGILKVVSCKLKPLKDGQTVRVRETADDITAADLDLAPNQNVDWMKSARKAISLGKAVRYGEDSKALEKMVEDAYLGSPPTTKSGATSTSRDTLSESGNDLLDEYGGTTNVSKLRGTYLPVLRQGTELPINAKFNVLVETGRTSCGEPNLQNLPREGGVRDCFVPRQGWVFSSVDYGAVEMCTLGQVCIDLLGYSRIAESINKGEDQHCRLAARLINMPYDEVVKRKKAKDKLITDIRQACKAANFGFPGGMGPVKFVIAKRKEKLDGKYMHICELSGAQAVCGTTPLVTIWNGKPCPPVCPVCVQEATRLRDAWMAEWEEIKEYFALISRATSGPMGGWLEHLRSKRVRGQVGFCDGANGLFQGLAADGGKAALWQVTKECYLKNGGPNGTKTALYGSRPVIWAHDEIIAECREPTAPEASERCAVVMVEEMQKFCPDVKITAEPTLMRRLYKEAACVRDENGRLKVWEPKAKAA